MSILLESDFLQADLRALFGQAAEGADGKGGGKTGTKPKKQSKKPSDWAAELKRRLEDNEKLTGPAKKSTGEIEKRFWEAYFNANFESSVAKKLKDLGVELKNDIKIFGFSPTKNPLLAFIKQAYVKKELILTGKLNKLSYRVIHDAFLNKQIANQELTSRREYNIIYCRDFYLKSPSEMSIYLKLQSDTVNPSGGVISGTQQVNNMRAMFQIGDYTNKSEEEIIRIANETLIEKLPKASSANTKLNPIELVSKINPKVRLPKAGRTEIKSETKLNEIISKFDTPEKIYAMVQYFIINNESNNLASVLTGEQFKQINSGALAKATIDVNELFKKVTIADKDINAFVERALKKLSGGTDQNEENDEAKEPKKYKMT
jgi:hypothetical protein